MDMLGYYRRDWPVLALVLPFFQLFGLVSPADGEELVKPPVCSRYAPIPDELKEKCEVTSLADPSDKERFNVKVNLTAQTAPVNIGGYEVVTENYNGTYLPPVVEAGPGDTVAARLINELKNRAPGAGHAAHGASGNPTNLHYFHGGIVTPRNERSQSIDAGHCSPEEGYGDNVYVHLENSSPDGAEFQVPIPGDGELNAGVLEETGFIPHPLGLNWYHSHLHGISSRQVMGGLAGLLSVGEDNANVRADCEVRNGTPDRAACDKDTDELKRRTIVRYALLRDISLRDISALPDEATADGAGKTATWAPQDKDFPPSATCAVWRKANSGAEVVRNDDPKLREGYCQRDEKSVWLFTVNGQRFPTMTVGDNQNLLLRLGNLSPNVAYWLELTNESTGERRHLTILSVDGVVPAKPVDPTEPGIPVKAFDVPDLLLMPASRAELYIRNDIAHEDTQVLVLRTKRLDVGTDVWPEIQLARVELQPSQGASAIELALNAPEAVRPARLAAKKAMAREPELPKGCVRDLKEGEHRRVTFLQEDPEDPSNKLKVKWSITTEIVRPPEAAGRHPENRFVSDEPNETTLKRIPFEAYEQPDGFDWAGKKLKHVCIRLDPGRGSHKQLWVLRNTTDSLHNFHIHQMKFRLATAEELREHRIEPPTPSSTCGEEKECAQPDYKYYEEDPQPGAAKTQPVWHDTIPVPVGRVFIIMSIDAPQQVGRFVFHCHILKHEDDGLMAPIEVWDPTTVVADR